MSKSVVRVQNVCPCDGCLEKIKRSLVKTPGIDNNTPGYSIDLEDGTITIKDSIDDKTVKTLVENLKAKFKRKTVTIISHVTDKQKKEKEEEEKKKKKKKQEDEAAAAKRAADALAAAAAAKVAAEAAKQKDKDKDKDKDRDKGKDKKDEDKKVLLKGESSSSGSKKKPKDGDHEHDHHDHEPSKERVAHNMPLPHHQDHGSSSALPPHHQMNPPAGHGVGYGPLGGYYPSHGEHYVVPYEGHHQGYYGYGYPPQAAQPPPPPSPDSNPPWTYVSDENPTGCSIM